MSGVPEAGAKLLNPSLRGSPPTVLQHPRHLFTVHVSAHAPPWSQSSRVAPTCPYKFTGASLRVIATKLMCHYWLMSVLISAWGQQP